MGQYIPGESMMHRLDPRVKLGSVIVLSTMILAGRVFTGTMISLFLVALILVSRLAPHHILKAFRPMAVFFALLFLLHLVFTDGTPIPPFPPWYVTITYEGLYRGLLITWDFALLVLIASVLTMTTSPTELVSGIERLLRPLRILRIPSHEVALMISIALRFVPTILKEIDRIKEAQMARGADFKRGSPVQRTKAIIALLTPVVIGSLRRAEELAVAMEGRGYVGGPRTYMKELCLTRADYIAVAVMIVIIGFNITRGYMSIG